MVQKEFTFYGKTLDELKNMSLKEFAEIAPARIRRTLKRGFTEQQKLFLIKLRKTKDGKFKKLLKTHNRDLVIIPEMIGVTIHLHNGKTFEPVIVNVEMLGHYLGEFIQTRKEIHHSAPGVGATKSSNASATRK